MINSPSVACDFTAVTIHTIKGRYANSYLIEDRGRFLVIDVHLNGEKYVLGHLKQVLGREPDDVDLVVCTHDHSDHIGGLAALARECNAQIGLPLAANSTLQKLKHSPIGSLHLQRTGFREMLRSRMWRMYMTRKPAYANLPVEHARTPSRASDVRVKADYRLRDGDSLPGFGDWLVLHTPGHTWDSCCYYHQPSGSLVTGDTILGSRVQNRPVLPAVYANPRQLHSSVQRLKTIDPQVIYPGHGKSFTGRGLLMHL